MSQEIIEKIKKTIEEYKQDATWEEVGVVTEVGDGIIKISGLTNVQSQEVLVIESGTQKTKAVALNLETDFVGALMSGNFENVKAGQTAKRTKQLLSIPVGEELLGRVVDVAGNPLDGKGVIFAHSAGSGQAEKSKPQYNFLENNAPNVLARESVNQPMHTGIKAIDSMIPIGRGQG